jgi:hypothetical protein
MSTKVFSTRLKSDFIDQIKLLSQKKSISLQETVENLLETSLNLTQESADPWASFVNQSYDKNDDLTDLIKDKRAKNLKLRKIKKTNFTNV